MTLGLLALNQHRGPGGKAMRRGTLRATQGKQGFAIQHRCVSTF